MFMFLVFCFVFAHHIIHFKYNLYTLPEGGVFCSLSFRFSIKIPIDNNKKLDINN